MLRRITGFHQDQEQHWVADLECGHCQHVRHDPPLHTRPWVLSEATRRTHLGTPLNCLPCDGHSPPEPEAPPFATPHEEAYDEARLRGLCEDGAAEFARHRPDDRTDSHSQRSDHQVRCRMQCMHETRNGHVAPSPFSPRTR